MALANTIFFFFVTQPTLFNLNNLRVGQIRKMMTYYNKLILGHQDTQPSIERKQVKKGLTVSLFSYPVRQEEQ